MGELMGGMELAVGWEARLRTVEVEAFNQTPARH